MNESQVKRQIKKDIAKYKKLAKDNKQSLQEQLYDALYEEESEFHKERYKIKRFNAEEMADWIIDKHDSYIETVNYMLQFDVLSATTYSERYVLIVFMQELNQLFSSYEIEIDKEVTDILADKGYAVLLSILNVLNYI